MRLRMLHGDREPPHCQRMMTFTDLASVPSHPLAPFTDRLRLAVAAYLARFKGSSRQHTESDLRCYLAWCAERGLDPWLPERAPGAVHPVDAGDPPVQGLHRLQPVLGRGRVLPDLRPRRHHRALARRARAPPFSARRITDPGIHPPAVRGPAHRRPGSCEPVRLRAGGHARPARPADLRSHQRGHRRPRREARPPGPARVRQGHQDGPGPAAARGRPGHRPGGQPPGSAGRSCSTPAAPGWTGTRPPAACATSPKPPASRSPGHIRICSVTPTSRPCSTLAPTCATSRSPPVTPTHSTTTRYDRARNNLDRHPNYILAAYMASGT